MFSDELVCLYLDAIEANPDAPTELITELIFTRLTEEQIVDAAAAALLDTDHLEPAAALAWRYTCDLVHALDTGIDR